MKRFLWGFLAIFIFTNMYASQTARRFAILIGANDGGAERVQLRYAYSDAEALARVLEELGGVAPSDITILRDPQPFTVVTEMDGLSRRLREAKKFNARVEVVVYYSGHSDEMGLLFGENRLPYSRFRDLIDNLPAELRIAVVDSCSSGAMTRTKGGKRLPPFLMDTSTSMKGYAFLTSSSATEASQESDLIQGSFFTHYLLTGLRGAADANQDGRVTLNEAYQFAFDETLARTQNTIAGPQHPTYDIQMTGAGEVVLTDLRMTTSTLVLANDVAGRVFVRNQDNRLVAELNKLQGKEVRLGLEEGDYMVTVARDGRLYRSEVTVKSGRVVSLDNRRFKSTDALYAVNKGLVATTTTTTTTTTIIEDDYYEEAEQTPVTTPQPAKKNDSLDKVIDDFAAGIANVVRNAVDDTIDSVFPARKAKRSPEQIMAEYGGNVADYTYKAVDFGIYTGPSANMTVTSFGVYLLFGYVNRINGFGIAGIGINVLEEMNGFVFAPLYTKTGYKTSGFQAAFGFNKANGIVDGVQTAFIFNEATMGVRGLQLAYIYNVSSMRMYGMQTAYIFNTASGNVRGIQVAGIFNSTIGNMVGIQVGGIYNVIKGDMLGVQTAGIFNSVTGSLDGVQIGLVNAGGDIGGAQVGLVNVGGDIAGIQVGLVNISKTMSGVPIGLINISGDGQNHLKFWIDETMFINAGFSFGTKYFYSTVYTGLKETSEYMNFGLGMGVHIPLGTKERLFMRFEGMAESVIPIDRELAWWWQDGGIDMIVRGRLGFGIKLLKWPSCVKKKST
jgi:hypothetical protein